MNFAEEVAGAVGDHLSKYLAYEDEESAIASHIVETVWGQSTATSVLARVYGFAGDGDTRIPLGRVRVTVTYEPDSDTTEGGAT